jgi:hypothetical protein
VESHRQQWRLVLAATLLLAAVQIAGFHAMRSDDAFVTYRYGQNLATGNGLTFNPGQRVQGSTSPGGMMLATLVYAIFGIAATPTVMAAVGCVAWAAQAAAVTRLLAPALGIGSAAVAGLAVGLGITNAAFFVPLETNVVAACALFAFALAREGRWLAAAISCGLAVLFRPDAMLAAVLLAAVCWHELRARAARPVAAFICIVLPFPLFATFYYGSPFPQTAIAKLNRTDAMEYLAHELTLPAKTLLRTDPPAWVAALVVVAILAGAARLLRRDKRLWPLLVYPLLHAAAYLLLLPPGQHSWHLYPWTLVCCICAMAALAPVEIPGRDRADWMRRAAFALVLIATVARFAGDWRNLASGYWTGERDAVYGRIARYLKANAPPGAWFASIEVGTIAYYSGMSAYDLGGLISRQDDPIAAHPVRFIVVDQAYATANPPSAPVFSAGEGGFLAHIYAPGGL